MATTKRIIIEGDLVTVVTIEEGKNYDGSTYRKETIGKTVKVDEWLEAVLATRGDQIYLPQLSDGQIIARKTKGVREVVVVEYRPAVRRIIWSEDKRTDRLHQLAFPYVYLVIRFYNGAVDTMYVYYRNEGTESLSADLYLSNLPNVYGSDYGYKICTGTISGLQSDWSFAKKLNWLAQQFWNSQFNKDLISYHWEPSMRLVGHPRSFADWEEKSRSDPGFILKIQWRSANKTIQQVLDEGVA